MAHSGPGFSAHLGTGKQYASKSFKQFFELPVYDPGPVLLTLHRIFRISKTGCLRKYFPVKNAQNFR
jgi:hypothetical protein